MSALFLCAVINELVKQPLRQLGLRRFQEQQQQQISVDGLKCLIWLVQCQADIRDEPCPSSIPLSLSLSVTLPIVPCGCVQWSTLHISPSCIMDKLRGSRLLAMQLCFALPLACLCSVCSPYCKPWRSYSALSALAFFQTWRTKPLSPMSNFTLWCACLNPGRVS